MSRNTDRWVDGWRDRYIDRWVDGYMQINKEVDMQNNRSKLSQIKRYNDDQKNKLRKIDSSKCVRWNMNCREDAEECYDRFSYYFFHDFLSLQLKPIGN